MGDAARVREVARAYYDSLDADHFYFEVWGGEDIHIGLYARPDEDIRRASQRTVETLAARARITRDTRVLDLGAGYGGAARHLARSFGCRVTCLNLSHVQNTRNRDHTEAAGLAAHVDVVTGSFEDVPTRPARFDLIWVQDAILHSGDKARVFREVRRALAPGGTFLFTDPMQAQTVPPGVLAPVLERIHLDSMGSFALYRRLAADVGLEMVETVDLTENLVRHYGRVREELERRAPELLRICSRDYLDRMQAGLGHWVDAGTAGHLAWGILELRAPR